MKNVKLNVLLAKTDHLGSSYKKAIDDFTRFFKTNQGQFQGEQKTYEPRAGTVDYPNERKNDLVVSTVEEKLAWLEETFGEYIDALFAQEATNASGTVKSKLIVEGKDLGEYSSLELLKLKSTLESGSLEEMYKNIPVREDKQIWKPTTNEMYQNRDIYESERYKGVTKTTVKEPYILTDPNLANAKGGNYQPSVVSRDTVLELGDYTRQRFTGEWSHRERADLLRRRTTLLTAVIEALKIANEAEVVPSELTSKKLFNYLHWGN